MNTDMETRKQHDVTYVEMLEHLFHLVETDASDAVSSEKALMNPSRFTSRNNRKMNASIDVSVMRCASCTRSPRSGDASIFLFNRSTTKMREVTKKQPP